MSLKISELPLAETISGTDETELNQNGVSRRARVNALLSTTAFTTLSDAPTDYSGQGGLFVRVKSTEDGLEFAAASGGSGGAVAVHDEGVEVLSTAAVLNFVGSAISAVDAGGDQVDITVTAGVAPVDSVFGRTGTVAAQTSDYDASQVDNDSGVAGARVSDALDVLDAGKLETASNLGAGSGIFAQKSGTTAELKSLVAGAGIQLNPGADSIEIVNLGSAGEVNTGANVGDMAGVGVFDGKSGTTLEFRRLKPDSNKLSVQVSAQTVLLDVVPGNLGLPTSVFGLTGAVDIDSLSEDATPATDDWLAKEVNAGGTFEKVQAATLAPAQSVGAGETIYKGRTGLTHEFKSIIAGTGVTLTPGTDTLQIDATGAGGGETNTASNLGTGEGVFAQKNGVDLEFKGLKATGGLGISSTADSVTLDGAALGGHPNPGTDTHASDADIAELDAGTAKEIQNITATYTADRTLPLPTSGATTGLFYVVRRAVPLHNDAFVTTVSIGGSPVCHIPAGHVAVVYRDSTTWRTWAGISPILTTASALLYDAENELAYPAAVAAQIMQLVSSLDVKPATAWGIFPNSGVDEAANIKAMLDDIAANALNSGVQGPTDKVAVWFEPGTYLCSEVLDTTAVRIIGAPNTVFQWNAASGAGTKLWRHELGGGAARVNFGKFVGCRFHGQSPTLEMPEFLYHSDSASDWGSPFVGTYFTAAGRWAASFLGATNFHADSVRADRCGYGLFEFRAGPLRKGIPITIDGQSTVTWGAIAEKLGTDSGDGTAAVTNGDATVVVASGGVTANVSVGDKFVAEVSPAHTTIYEVASKTSDTEFELTTTWAGATDAAASFLIPTNEAHLLNHWVEQGYIASGTVARAAAFFGRAVVQLPSDNGGYHVSIANMRPECNQPMDPAGNGIVLDQNADSNPTRNEITLINVAGFVDDTGSQLVGFTGTAGREPNVTAINSRLDGASRSIRDYTAVVSHGDGDESLFYWRAASFTQGAPADGDMLASVYDPQGIADDAFDLGVHTGTIPLAQVSDSGALAALDTVSSAELDTQAVMTEMGRGVGFNLADGAATFNAGVPEQVIFGTAASSFDYVLPDGAEHGSMIKIVSGVSANYGGNTVRVLDAAGTPKVLLPALEPAMVYEFRWNAGSGAWGDRGRYSVNKSPGALAAKDAIDTPGELKPLGQISLLGGDTHTITQNDHMRVIVCQPDEGGTPGDIVLTFDDEANFEQSFKCTLYLRDSSATERVQIFSAAGDQARGRAISGGRFNFDDVTPLYLGLADGDNEAIALVENVHSAFDNFIVWGHVRSGATDDLTFGALATQAAVANAANGPVYRVGQDDFADTSPTVDETGGRTLRLTSATADRTATVTARFVGDRVTMRNETDFNWILDPGGLIGSPHSFFDAEWDGAAWVSLVNGFARRATQGQAEAGIQEWKFMDPLRTAQAIAAQAAPTQIPSDANPYTLPLTSRSAFHVEIPTHANAVQHIIPNTAPAGSKWQWQVEHTGNYVVIEGDVGLITPNMALDTGGDATESKRFVKGGTVIAEVTANTGSAPTVKLYGAIDKEDVISGALTVNGDRLGRIIRYTGTGDTFIVDAAPTAEEVSIENDGTGSITVTATGGTITTLKGGGAVALDKSATLRYFNGGASAKLLVET